VDYSLTTPREKIGSLTHRRKTTIFRKITGIKAMVATQQMTFGKINVLCEWWGINSEAATGCLLSDRL